MLSDVGDPRGAPVRDASPGVDRFLAALVHPLKAGVDQLRAGILAVDPGIGEHLEGNAPSYRYGGEDRVTFRLQSRDQLQLVFHRGARMRADSAEFVFADPSGLVVWRAPDRGVVTFPDLAAVTAAQPAVLSLVAAWIAV
jgi:hypothetical protein